MFVVYICNVTAFNLNPVGQSCEDASILFMEIKLNLDDLLTTVIDKKVRPSLATRLVNQLREGAEEAVLLIAFQRACDDLAAPISSPSVCDQPGKIH